jgi:hypothetical protein
MLLADALAQPLRSQRVVLSRTFVALTLACLGYPDQALRRSHEALTLAQSSDPFTLYYALHMAGQLHRLCREVHVAHERFEAALALASEQGLAQWLPISMHEWGWVLAAQGQPEAYGNSGQVEEGLCLLAEALAVVDNTGERRDVAELYRIKGELLLQEAIPDMPQAETCFQQALAIARRQQAQSWELRAAMSLCRLWQRQGKRDKARALLAPIYGWFTEGFDTADLQDAKALLDELA